MDNLLTNLLMNDCSTDKLLFLQDKHSNYPSIKKTVIIELFHKGVNKYMDKNIFFFLFIQFYSVSEKDF